MEYNGSEIQNTAVGSKGVSIVNQVKWSTASTAIPDPACAGSISSSSSYIYHAQQQQDTRKNEQKDSYIHNQYQQLDYNKDPQLKSKDEHETNGNIYHQQRSQPSPDQVNYYSSAKLPPFLAGGRIEEEHHSFTHINNKRMILTRRSNNIVSPTTPNRNLAITPIETEVLHDEAISNTQQTFLPPHKKTKQKIAPLQGGSPQEYKITKYLIDNSPTSSTSSTPTQQQVHPQEYEITKYLIDNNAATTARTTQQDEYPQQEYQITKYLIDDEDDNSHRYSTAPSITTATMQKKPKKKYKIAKYLLELEHEIEREKNNSQQPPAAAAVLAHRQPTLNSQPPPVAPVAPVAHKKQPTLTAKKPPTKASLLEIKHEEQWNFRYQQLVEYTKKHGNPNVPARYTPNIQLANWIMTQKRRHNLTLARKDKVYLSPDRFEKLNKLNFRWKESIDQWDKRFNELVEFKKKHGHCFVPQRYTNNPSLGSWVNAQRIKKISPKLRSEERREKLDSIGFVWNAKYSHPYSPKTLSSILIENENAPAETKKKQEYRFTL